MRFAMPVFVLFCTSYAGASGWDDGPPCATSPDGCAPPARPVEETPRLESPFVQRRVVVNLHLGLDTPYGMGGIALDVSPAEALALEAGAGLGGAGPQVAVMPRARLVLGSARRDALSFGFGGAVGPHESGAGGDGLLAPMSAMSHASPDTKVWERAWWLAGEISWERRMLPSALAVRAYAGFKAMLNPSDYRCEYYLGYGCDEDEGGALMYAGVALGRSF